MKKWLKKSTEDPWDESVQNPHFGTSKHSSKIDNYFQRSLKFHSMFTDGSWDESQKSS